MVIALPRCPPRGAMPPRLGEEACAGRTRTSATRRQNEREAVLMLAPKYVQAGEDSDPLRSWTLLRNQVLADRSFADDIDGPIPRRHQLLRGVDAELMVERHRQVLDRQR